MRSCQNASRASWSMHSRLRGRGLCTGGARYPVGTTNAKGTFCMCWKACGMPSLVGALGTTTAFQP
eukprot:9265231-Pyramimonas_sp.AAC.1